MLTELRVEDLGVIEELGLVLGPGMTVLSGETGAGKTLVVEAIELLVGARADTSLVRSGADEARVEARFELDDALSERIAADPALESLDVGSGELVLTRVVAEGRSRAYVDGRVVPVGLLGELGRHLVDLHGQHTHHALLSPGAQRAALDRYAGAAAADTLDEYRRERARLHEIAAELAELGGDQRERAREIELLAFQIEEIDAAEIRGPGDDEELAREERLLSDAGALRDASREAHEILEAGGLDAVGGAVKALEGREHFADSLERLRVLQDELADLARGIRVAGEGIEEDPERLAEVQARRARLAELRRKYGATLSEVLAYRDDAEARRGHLEHAGARAGELEEERAAVLERARGAARRLSEVRRDAAGGLGEAISEVLVELAMPSAEFSVEVESREVGDDLPRDGADDVRFLLSANRGEVPQPLSRVASGGELARTMLAARVVLTEAPPTLVFDEVDAGIGGEAGVAVGRRLAVVARGHQVLCVTHLAQVAAHADAQVVVTKHEHEGRTRAEARPVEGSERVAELSRMLAGSGTEAARDHAEELLVAARRGRGR